MSLFDFSLVIRFVVLRFHNGDTGSSGLCGVLGPGRWGLLFPLHSCLASLITRALLLCGLSVWACWVQQRSQQTHTSGCMRVAGMASPLQGSVMLLISGHKNAASAARHMRTTATSGGNTLKCH